MIAGLYSLMIKIEILGTSCIMVLMHLEDTPIPSRGYGRVHPMAGQRSLCLHSAAMTVTNSNGCPAKELPEYARRTRKVAQQCAN